MKEIKATKAFEKDLAKVLKDCNLDTDKLEALKEDLTSEYNSMLQSKLRKLNSEEEKPVFSFINSLEKELDEDVSNIKKVTFDISRYGNYTHTINFKNPVSEKEAVEKVEQWLSVPTDKRHYNKVSDDLFSDNQAADSAFLNKPRGALLGDAIYLESINIEKGHATIYCGS